MSLPTCAGPVRQYVCGLCGRSPSEPCPRQTPPQPEPPRMCPACDGTGFWPKTTTQECLVCKGTGRWGA